MLLQIGHYPDNWSEDPNLRTNYPVNLEYDRVIEVWNKKSRKRSSGIKTLADIAGIPELKLPQSKKSMHNEDYLGEFDDDEPNLDNVCSPKSLKSKSMGDLHDDPDFEEEYENLFNSNFSEKDIGFSDIYHGKKPRLKNFREI